MAEETDEDEDIIPTLHDEYPSLWVLSGVPMGYRKERSGALFPVTYDQYAANRKATRRGTANPSLMNNPFWLSQVGPQGIDGWTARTAFGNVVNPYADSKDPVWSFMRFGATCTKLPDGRLVCIGGEHEDWSDPDFCIYNDVVVYDAPQETDPPPLLTPECIKIYGYPANVFPPTDFHTSTYYADSTTGKETIFIIGGHGYVQQAWRVQTDVYKLDLSDFSIQRVATSGRGPIGPTHHHKAELLIENEQPVIKVTTKAEERSEEANGMSDGEEESASSSESEGTLLGDDDDDEESGTTTDHYPESATTEGSEAFTLRIHDMRWI